MPVLTSRNRPFISDPRCVCAKCGAGFGRDERVRIIEERTSWMRGDDIVEFYHLACSPHPKDRAKAALGEGSE